MDRSLCFFSKLHEILIKEHIIYELFNEIQKQDRNFGLANIQISLNTPLKVLCNNINRQILSANSI